MADITNAQIKLLVDGITIARGPFATAFDEFAPLNGTPLFRQIAEEANQAAPLEVGHIRDRRDYAAALRAARDDGWLVDFVFQRFGDLAAGAQPASQLQLQSIVVRTRRFVDAKRVEINTLAASRRCGQVLITRPDAAGNAVPQPLGTGFLIGPHLALTNHHVIRDLLQPDGRTPDPTAPRPQLRFDYHQGVGGIDSPEIVECVDSWLLHTSPNAPVTAPAGDLEEALDYAILVLDGLPGHSRGWYDLGQVDKPPAANAPLEMWQFPLGQPMKFFSGLRAEAPAGQGFEALAADAVPPRMFYMINTLEGSSGGLVLDASTKLPVALHDAGYTDNSADQTRPNRGIPLWRIREEAMTVVTQAIVTLPPKIGWHPMRNQPILARERLQRLIFNAAHGETRIMAVITPPDAAGARVPRIGRSFTRTVLEACLPAADHHILTFTSAWVDPDPFVTARRIVQMIDPDLAAGMPVASGETTLDADATGLLVEETVRRLRDAVPGKTVWLMIDDIDTHPIGTQWGSSAYLVALYRRAAVVDALRIVLTGLPRQLEGMTDLEEQRVLESEILDTAPGDGDLDQWLQAHLAGSTWPAEIAPRLGRLIRSVAETRLRANGTARPATCLIEAIDAVLADHARRAFLPGGGTDG